MTVVPAVTCFSRTTPASGARTGTDSPVSPVGSSLFVTPRCSSASSARRTSVLVWSSSSRAATWSVSARCRSWSESAFSSCRRPARSAACVAHASSVSRRRRSATAFR